MDEISGVVVGVRQQQQRDAARLFTTLFGMQVAAVHVRCAGTLPSLDQASYDPGQLFAKRVLQVRDCRLNGKTAWIARVDGDVVEALASPQDLKEGDPVVFSDIGDQRTPLAPLDDAVERR